MMGGQQPGMMMGAPGAMGGAPHNQYQRGGQQNRGRGGMGRGGRGGPRHMGQPGMMGAPHMQRP